MKPPEGSWPLFVDGDATLVSVLKKHHSVKVKAERRSGLYESGGPPNRRERARDYCRHVWWALCDLGTVIRGGDPS